VSALRDGRFAAAFTAPASTYITHRAQATDAAGNSITETVTSAYQTTP
jgi:hypothetical protein